jgi:hypothetical protein
MYAFSASSHALIRDGPGKAPYLAQVVISEERRTLSLKQKSASETSVGQIGVEVNFRVGDYSSGIPMIVAT